MNKNQASGLRIFLSINIPAVAAISFVGLFSIMILLWPPFSESVTAILSLLVTFSADIILNAAGKAINIPDTLSESGSRLAGSFYSFKFILWAIVISLIIIKPGWKKSILTLLTLIFAIVILNIIRLVLFSAVNVTGNILTSGMYSLPYRILLFLLPVLFFISSGRLPVKRSFDMLRSWRDNTILVFIFAAVAGSLPGLMYDTGFFMFEWVIYTVFTMAKGLLAVFSVVSSFTGRYLTNDHTSIYMSDSCAGLKVIVMFIALVFAGRGRTRSKLAVALAGTLTLLVLNAVRVAILFEINNEGMPAPVFDWWHSNFKYLFYIAVAAMWMLWLRISGIQNKQPDNT